MKNHHVKNERAPIPVAADIPEPSLSHWGYTCIVHLASIEQLLICICMCEKLKSLRAYSCPVLQRIRSLLQKRTRYQSSKWMDAYFFTAFVFFVSINYRSLHRHFQYRCGCSNCCLFFWRNLAYKTEQDMKADERAVLKDPTWPDEVQRLGRAGWAA